MFTKIAVIGTGNIGTWLFETLQTQSHLSVLSISSRKIETLPKNFDLYIFALKDDIYEIVLQKIPFKMPHAVHTSGSLSQNILAPFANKFGVVYPYQTISQKVEGAKVESTKAEGRMEAEEKSPSNFEGVSREARRGSFYEVPICIEGSDSVFENALFQWATSLFNIVYKVAENQRFAMHLAAVFANNFTNAMYNVAYHIFKENNLDWSLIFPLLENTLEKAKHNAPHLVQTGPAVRNDVSIMEKHCNALKDEELKALYRLASKIILNRDSHKIKVQEL
ncbi:MAG: DUF2520 domain-containing protein [Bacteroidetes bacterium]|nr:DUF2520 domain-containing protein [Bacteroidota bacterium]MCL2303234.1 DUF2520 domain-containing protein [Lentimicrobiaceae bacterium]